MTTIFRRAGVAGLVAGLLATAPAHAAESQFATRLLPGPMTAATRDAVTGTGDVTATLNGATLTISGTFQGLASPATAAHLQSGLLEGVVGPQIALLTVTAATSGTVSGTVTLTRAQIAALRRKSVYVQIDSVKAPGPYGTVWGWFESRGQ